MDSGDDRSSTAGVGLDWTLIPGPASALIDMTVSQARQDNFSRTCRITLKRPGT
jgi:hypothetical protein